MSRNILELLEDTAQKFPNKIIYEDINRNITYRDFINVTKKIGTAIAKEINDINRPIAIFIDRSVTCLETMMGTTYSGNYFIVLDTKSPKQRLDLILRTLPNVNIIVESKNIKKIEELEINGKILVYENLLQVEVDEEKLNCIKNKIIDTDPMYLQFTSGSTGIPKGIVICHKSVITYATSIKKQFIYQEERHL